MKRVLLSLILVGLLFVSLSLGMSLAELLLYDELTGFWQVIEDVDPSTGELITTQLVLHSTHAHEKLSPAMEVQDVKALYIRLLDGNIDIFVAWNEDLGDSADVVYRFDDEQEIENTWYRSMGRVSLFFPRQDQDPKSFVEMLLVSDCFEIRVIPQDLGISTQVFDLRGLGNAILPYLRQFGWEDLEKVIADL